jgi:hemoglobin
MTQRSTSVIVILLLSGCASEEKKDRDFHTSGSREADQRAEQRVNKVQQLRGEGQSGEDGDAKPSLYERLGGESGIRTIVDDFVARAVADPRVNWERKGIKRGGLLGVGGKSVEWNPTAENLATLKHHLAQFIAVATGGPSRYEGRDMKAVHAGMEITNAEFDATIGDLKATLDTLRYPVEVQKELLSILESARPQIAEER